MSSLDYDEIQRLLAVARPMAELAEAHGTLVGALCAAPEYRLEDWIGEILPEGPANPGVNSALRAVFLDTGAALGDRGMEFAMLLPGDAHALAERASSLGAWCQGFLYGLGTSRIGDSSRLPGTAGEIVRDLMEITRVGVDAQDSEESNEQAYAELVEFVRVGVQLLFEELAPLREPPRPQDSLPPVLH
jgi:uncharacterized protein YgfB (UPF0149 family)